MQKLQGEEELRGSTRCRVYFQPSFPALENSAELGCDLCILLYDAIKSSLHSELYNFEVLCSGKNFITTIGGDPSDTRIRVVRDQYLDDDVLPRGHAQSISRLQLEIGGSRQLRANLRISADES